MKYSLLFFIAILSKNCDSQKSSASSLEGFWKVTSIENNKIIKIHDTKCIINFEDKSLNISIGCNNYKGYFDKKDYSLKIKHIIATEKYCR